MKIRRALLKDTVSVETYSGDSAYGPVYATATSVACSIDATRRLVRTAAGDEVVSEMTLYVHPDDTASFTPESRLTVSGRTSRVLTVTSPTMRGYAVVTKVTAS